MAREGGKAGSNPIKVRRTVSAVVDDCLRGHAKGGWPVSLARTVSEIRIALPDCDLSDADLADLIAIRAIETGCDVMFDADLLDGPRSASI